MRTDPDLDMGKVRLSVGKVAWCLIDRSFYIVQHCLRKLRILKIFWRSPINNFEHVLDVRHLSSLKGFNMVM